MDVNVSWYFEDRILMLVFPGITTLEALYTLAEQCAHTLDTSTYDKVHILMDASEAQAGRHSLVALKNALTPVARHDRLGMCVLYGTHDAQIHQDWTLVARIARINLHITRGRFEALQYLRRMDRSLPKLSDAHNAQSG